MIVRESPSPRRHVESGENARWPPQSARDVHLSSPSRRKRLQSDLAGRSVSPSPSKRRRLINDHMHKGNGNDDEEDDEDEETIRLKLQAIEARLKLKKIQKFKHELPATADDGAAERRQLGGSSQQPEVEVPTSPKPRNIAPAPQKSPRRIQLGIDKGVRASEVSLKKPGVLSATASAKPSNLPLKPQKSFSERLAESRSQDIARQDKRERLEQRQSHSFNLSKSTTVSSSTGPSKNKSGPNLPTQVTGVDTSNVLPASHGAENIKHIQEPQANGDPDSYSGFALSKRNLSRETLQNAFEGKELFPIPRLLRTVVSPQYDPPDVEDDFVVFGIVASKSLPRDLAAKNDIKSNADPDEPGMLPPKTKFMVIRLTDLTWELDLFLFDTAFHEFWKLTVGTVIAILNPGIMPPKPNMKDTGKFSLKLSCSEDSLLEIGTARNLAFCKETKKDGHDCTQWIDARKTEFCEFHISLRSRKSKAGRMEINTMASLSSFGKGSKKSKSKSKKGKKRWLGGSGAVERERYRERMRNYGRASDGQYFDMRSQGVAYVIPQQYCNTQHTTRLLDMEDYVHGGLSKEERSRRKFAEVQKEHELARSLVSLGSGPGREYMRIKGPEPTPSVEVTQTAETSGDAMALGLVRHKAEDARLSPVTKRGRIRAANTAEPIGWSGAFKRGLLSPSKNENAAPKRSQGLPEAAESSSRDTGALVSPSKRARFFLEEKGIRVPGRESGGKNTGIGRAVYDDDEDDDGLDILY